MTLVRSRPDHDYLELAVTLLRECRSYFVHSDPTLEAATAAVTELETWATNDHPASAVARRWRVSRVFILTRDLRDGLAGVRLMVESATKAAGPTAALSLLNKRLTNLDKALKALRTEPWSQPDDQIVTHLITKAPSEHLKQARHESARAAGLLEEVLRDLTKALDQ